jgi:hypothetical protein
MADPRANPKTHQLATRLGTFALGLSIAAAGAVFCAALWHGFQRAEETRGWQPAPALITASYVENIQLSKHDPIRYRARVTYRYVHHGVPHIGDRIRRVDGNTTDRSKAEAITHHYPIGTSLDCFVDPSDPSFSILRHESRAPLYSIWFPALFIVGGLGICVGAFRRKAPATHQPPADKPPAEQGQAPPAPERFGAP